MYVDQHHRQGRTGLKVVCEECGNLSIKPIDPVNTPDDAEIHCRRCNAVRGTLGDLRELARKGADVFEF